ncbi:hypothetical protein [Luteolibacter sp. Populi]|uniref:hypothetical protein n=1 Tax=Luteolibacter sp. Populi TaxID=3230487 RepID=UPI003467865C
MKTIERRVSFNGGEFSPWTDPRIDMEKYRTGCRRLENFRPAIYGGAFSRAGTLLVGRQANGAARARLVPFEFSAETSLMLEFTHLELRVFTAGAVPQVPLMTTAAVDEASWAGGTFYKRGTWVNYTGGGPPRGTYVCKEDHIAGATLAEHIAKWGTPFTAGYYTAWAPGTAYVTGDIRMIESGANAGVWRCAVSHTSSSSFATDLGAGTPKWEVRAEFKRATPYEAEELDELQFAQQNDLIIITHPKHAPRVLSRYADNKWTIEPLVQEWPALRDENITDTTLTAGAVTGSAITITANPGIFNSGHEGTRWVMRHRRKSPYKVLAFKDALLNALSGNLFVLGDWSLTCVTGAGTGSWEAVAVVERSYNKVTWETVRSLVASRTDRSGIITGTEIDPCWLRVRLDAISGAGTAPDHGKYTLEAVDPDHYGIFEVTDYSSPTSVTAKVIFEIEGVVPTKDWAEPAWSDYRGWPRTVCLHETRLFFGGNAAQPQTIWGSTIDDYYNFRLGSNDDMALAFTLAQRADSIQWLVSQEALLVGTAGAEGPVGSREQDKALSPVNAKAGRFSQTGSAFIQAVAVQDAVVFINRSRRKAWEFAFSFEADGFKANDLTLLAEHVADGGIRQIALQRKPDPVLWAVDASGQLLGVAYERSQRVAGWFRYVTEGTIESVAALGGDGEEDQVWITVLRAGGRFIERFQPERGRLLKEGDQAHLCGADAAVIREGGPATVIGGLSHLEGQEVCVLADGAPQSNRTVAGGEIVLDAPAAVVIAGLPFACYLQPTFMETNDPASVSKVAWKNIHRVTLELWKSLGCSVSCNGGETWERVEFLQQGDAMDEALPLFTGVRELLVEGRSERQVSPILRQDQPLPLNVQSLHVWHEMNGA